MANAEIDIMVEVRGEEWWVVVDWYHFSSRHFRAFRLKIPRGTQPSNHPLDGYHNRYDM